MPFRIFQTVSFLIIHVACLALWAAPCRAETDAAALRAERRQLESAYQARLASLADACAGEGQIELANLLRDWSPQDVDAIRIFDPNGAVAISDCDPRFKQLRIEQADLLFELGRRAASANCGALAIQLCAHALRENPDHPNARRVFGYEFSDGVWRTAYEVRQDARGAVWRPSFGWISQRDVERYESGLRPQGRRWIPADEDAARRKSIESGWTIRTEHFLLTTNTSLEEGAHRAEQLELQYRLWTQLFAEFAIGNHEIKRVFQDGKTSRRASKPFRVRFYATRDEYNATLAGKQPLIAKTLGIYFASDRMAHFFDGEEQHPATIVHEMTHQFFNESRRNTRGVGEIDNFWVVEAVATYMESMEAEERGNNASPGHGAGPNQNATAAFTPSFYEFGGPNSGRLPAARDALSDGGYYVRFEELVRLGKDDFQRRPDLQKLYSQIAGQMAFLLHVDGGRYRDAAMEYLDAVYSGRADASTLSDVTGAAYPTLDREYAAWIGALPKTASGG